MEKQDILKNKITHVQERANHFLRQIELNGEYQDSINPEAIETMLQTLEELSVAEEELRVQNDELANTRLTIEAERARYLELFEFAPDGYLVTNIQGVIQEANQAAVILLNTPVHWLIGKPLITFVHDDEKNEFRRQLSHLSKSGRVSNWDFYLKPRDRNALPVSATVAAILKDNQEISELRWMLRDITVQYQAQQELELYQDQLEEKVKERTTALEAAQERMIRQERLATMGQLAGQVGHELRNSLGVISNAIYYINTVGFDSNEVIRECFQLIQTSINDATRIVNDLLGFARVRKSDPSSVQVHELVEQILSQLPTPENIQIELDIPPNLPDLYVDPHQVKQVLTNLITNAYQSMSPSKSSEILNGGKLIIAARKLDAFIELSVSDTGTGIPPENRDKIFTPLFTTKSTGIGFGLTVCKNLVEANQGNIEFESEVGEGTVFTLKLPIFKKHQDVN